MQDPPIFLPRNIAGIRRLVRRLPRTAAGDPAPEEVSQPTSRHIRKYVQTIREGIGDREANLRSVAQKVEIELSGEEREELRRLARSETMPFRQVQRARMILYSTEGMTDMQIADRLDCTPECVGKWRRRFAAGRLEGLTDLKRAGRPRRFPPGAGRRGEGDRLRAARHARPAALALQPH